MIVVKESETLIACHQPLERHGLFVAGSTGAVYTTIQRHFSDKSVADGRESLSSAVIAAQPIFGVSTPNGQATL